MNPEYDFADDNEATNEQQADEQSTGDNEYSDGEGIQGPPPPTEFKRLLEGWARDFEKLVAASGLSTNDCIGRHLRGRSTYTNFSKLWKPQQPLSRLQMD